jgi:chaperonin cofactor prefoldin
MENTIEFLNARVEALENEVSKYKAFLEELHDEIIKDKEVIDFEVL